MDTDCIVKKIFLRAPRKRVWRALADSAEFGMWFGVKFDGQFSPGAAVHGVIVGSQVNLEVAKAQKAHEGTPFDITIDRMDPERLFSFRWHPFAVDRAIDYSAEPTTLIEFALEETPGGVLLTVTESGFDQIPLARRAEAFKANEGGWAIMIRVIEEFLAQKP
ncbi:MAG TPA: SRPBCC family protein [Candidatus Acidoferrum sp.]|nr:SRPBCC family protein [Candidatus Acidoferrum sp.]